MRCTQPSFIQSSWRDFTIMLLLSTKKKKPKKTIPAFSAGANAIQQMLSGQKLDAANETPEQKQCESTDGCVNSRGQHHL